MLDEIIRRIKDGKKNSILEKAVNDADFQQKLYTGKNQDEIITNYRINESDNQKKQRKRITISRTKHIIRQIENVINQLANLDKPAIDVYHENEAIIEDVKNFIYNNNLDKIAFEFIKHFNIVDANAFIVAGVNEVEEIDFVVYPSSAIFDMKVMNDNLKYVCFKLDRKVKDGLIVSDYFIYYDKGVIKLYDRREYNGSGTEVYEGFIIENYDTNVFYCFPVGAIKDVTNLMKTYISILESSSELFKSLIWQGSELDSNKATHGIIQKFQRTTPCTNVGTIDDKMCQCVNGKMYSGNDLLGQCQKCKGTGLAIHTSSQDIIMLPMPKPGDNTNIGLSDLVHIEYVPDGFLNFLKEEINELKAEIIRSVFNASNLTKPEIAQTATEAVIDLQGIYATLNLLGSKVSDAFIWMVDVYCDVKGYSGVSTLHGYTFNLKLETIETLSDKRKKLTDAGAPIEVIKAVDMAILQKQNIDNPQAINKYVIWEKYRPFNEKSNDQVNVILMSLPETNYYKVLYNFFGIIKNKILDVHGSAFYDYNNERRIELINAEVNAIIEEIRAGSVQPSFPGVDFNL